MTDPTPWWEPPQHEDGSYDVVQGAREVSSYVSEVGGYIDESASICSEIREQLPPRGSLTDLCLELFAVLDFVEAKWAYADDALLSLAMLSRIEARHAAERA